MHKQKKMMRDLLQKLQNALIKADLWATTPPPPIAFLSQAPFCIDTMKFQQWLQFVLIPKMHALIEQNNPLPSNIALTPMAEEAFKNNLSSTQEILTILERIDTLSVCINKRSLFSQKL